jgi:hypothetical protein
LQSKRRKRRDKIDFCEAPIKGLLCPRVYAILLGISERAIYLRIP